MLVTNTPAFGGDLSSIFFRELSSSTTDRLRMISGYVGKETIAKLRSELTRQKRIAVELVVGMAAREGVTQATYDELLKLNSDLQGRKNSKNSRQGVFVFFSGSNGERSRGMHAKAYLFDQGTKQRLIVGSSNFSFSGMSPVGNVELNIVDSSIPLIRSFEQFFEDLHFSKQAVRIDYVADFPIRGRAMISRKSKEAALTKVARPSNFRKFGFVDIDLARNIENQSRSNLNCCFGKGRWSRSTGIVRPRDWYEVELISPIDITSNPNYPKGDFDATTTDGYQFKAVTNGDFYKNLRSADDLKILGIWLKGLLEDAGSLSDDPQEMVTRETFSHYGNSILRIYRPSSKSAILHFPRDASQL